ncbi:hypothetical protein BHE74_00052039 [Ensete ventricosum]|uniref:Uncharacterized protein n=1 Tax=Ensete ventricosum TaxID=4639 RepID=A0A444C3C9_ENSVE|nr:hypothetical protein B296_00038600 [Ensete ventricosum]RWV80314.1 hypothetical protein GW17_00058440 [Ensete ventricosum]RWW42420.1 hypothetical protein BHE74_00052039 [Ensete ventricosum]
MSCFDCFCACSRETSCRKKDSAVVQTNSGVLSDSSSGYLWRGGYQAAKPGWAPGEQRIPGGGSHADHATASESCEFVWILC